MINIAEFDGAKAAENMFAELQKLTIALNKNVLTVDELAMLSGLTKGYIYNLVHYKKIPHYKSEGGKLTYFKKDEVEKWLCAKYVPTQAETEAKHGATNRHKNLK